MPVLLDDITPDDSSVGAAKLTPKFFSSTLTGKGGKTGLLNSSVHPSRYPSGQSSTTLLDMITTKTRTSGSSTITHRIPFAPLIVDSIKAHRNTGLHISVPQAEETFHVNEGRSNNAKEVYFGLTPQGAVLTEDSAGETRSRELNILYRMEVYVLDSGSTTQKAILVENPRTAGDEYVMVDYSYGPLEDAEALIARATSGLGQAGQPGSGVYLDEDALAEWMADYDLTDRLSQLAEIWTDERMGEIIAEHITDIFASGVDLSTQQLHTLAYQLRYLESYPVALESYRAIHAALSTNVPQDLALSLSKQNLNLLMSHTLEDLNTLKPQLSTPPQQSSATTLPSKISAQQRAAITTSEPLTLVQAGAGTGKSTVILNRIDHLTGSGVDAKDITVLSFTNAAADNIKEKNPAVGSMTIASMIHDIYKMNYSGHGLSSIETILNSLDIFYPSSEFAAAFRKYLLNVDKDKVPGATTALNVFVEKYYDEVIDTLNTIGQTCLELEIIICYQRIEQLAEPAEIMSKYLIIDEVQDNSIFEFIFTLKYVAKHRENLFIVGDASQTLYEFRAANPRALNALEGSGVFATYQLTTNYRSNQEILDFANIHLAEIEANKSASLRLQANSLDMPTADSFQKKVNLHYELVSKLGDFKENYSNLLSSSMMRNYIDEKLAAGEQVAFLMFSRADVKATEETLAKLYPHEPVANLTSERIYSTTVFSQYIKMYWNDVKQVNPADASFAVTQGIMSNLAALTKAPEKAQQAVQNMVSEWWINNAAAIRGWVAQHTQGGLSTDGFFYNLRQNMLDFEIQKNRLKLQLNNERNRERKEKNLQAKANLVVSTIHGAKGLEFDNTVVIHKNDSQLPEDAKRMYYVAFTRAMKSTFVLSYGKQKNPRITSDYDLIVEQLAKRDRLQQLRDQGYDPDAMDTDDVAAALAVMDQQRTEESESSEDSADDGAGGHDDVDDTAAQPAEEPQPAPQS